MSRGWTYLILSLCYNGMQHASSQSFGSSLGAQCVTGIYRAPLYYLLKKIFLMTSMMQRLLERKPVNKPWIRREKETTHQTQCRNDMQWQTLQILVCPHNCPLFQCVRELMMGVIHQGMTRMRHIENAGLDDLRYKAEGEVQTQKQSRIWTLRWITWPMLRSMLVWTAEGRYSMFALTTMTY